MKRIMSVVGFLVLMTLSGFGQQTGVFFRIVSTTNSRITALSSDGTLAWTNAATAGVSCVIQRATTLTGSSNWVDYVQHGVTNATMTMRIYDPNPIVGMRFIPAGINSGTDPDFGAYSLTVAAFYMDATEVTKAMWDEVYAWAASNGYSFDNTGLGKATNHPVHTVNWYDCVKWSNARSQKEGKTPCYTVGGIVYKTGQSTPACNSYANGYRLPTQTEWQYAARGGPSGRRFPWGNIIDHTRANYYGYPSSHTYDQGYAGYDGRYATGGYPYTSPVGRFSANGYGLYDMAGNVSEWCYDTSDSVQRLCGGDYGSSDAPRCHSYGNSSPAYTFRSFGFRTVCR